MAYLFHHRGYRLCLRVPIRTAQGAVNEREGVVVRLQPESGPVGYGEAAPLSWFGTEGIGEVIARCELWQGQRVRLEEFQALPARLSCLRYAIESALTPAQPSPPADDAAGYRSVAALVPAGAAAITQVREKGEAGFRVFKWKVGVTDAADEMALLSDVCAALPDGARLRLDANGAWDRRRAERWLGTCADFPIEFVEQPIDAAARGAQDLLLGLAADYPTPLALDESIVRDGDVARWLGAGWPGVYVIKPSLLGAAAETLAKLAAVRAKVVFSSALETAVGARAALDHAFRWPGERLALGFGVWPLFADPRFDGPAAAPFLRWQDVMRIEGEAIWNALS